MAHQPFHVIRDANSIPPDLDVVFVCDARFRKSVTADEPVRQQMTVIDGQFAEPCQSLNRIIAPGSEPPSRNEVILGNAREIDAFLLDRTAGPTPTVDADEDLDREEHCGINYARA
jgi:hypothetical protein